MMAELFQSRAAFEAAFADGLAAMLDDAGLGAFILVLANACSDDTLWRALQQPLARRFEGLRRAHARGELNDAAPDDLAVFERLCEVGYDQLQQATHRTVGPWQLQFNHLRSFRPPRMSDARVETLRRDFDATGFHFNKPFLRKEILWEGELLGGQCRWLYNKFPFAPLHTLLVLASHEQRPQFLRQADHQRVWQLTETLGETLPGIGFGYNAYGAFSSVNHQHLQGYIRAADHYPVEDGAWQHNGGELVYPVSCHRYSDAAAAWAAVDALHTANTPYNLLYRPACCYVLPRAFQGSYQHADWTAGFAWSELAGAFTLFDSQKMAALDGAAISAEFAKLRL